MISAQAIVGFSHEANRSVPEQNDRTDCPVLTGREVLGGWLRVSFFQPS